MRRGDTLKILDDHAPEAGNARSSSAQAAGDDPKGHAPLTEKGKAPLAVEPAGVAEARRAQLQGDAPQMWRSLDELADTEEFRELVQNEFPRYAPQEWDDTTSRRSFLQVAGASIGLAGLAACTRQPRERIIPYVEQPENLVPGNPLFFATSMPHRGYAIPLLAESHMGRPTKVTGNRQHPDTLGGSDLFSQASVLGLYDPDRSGALQYQGKILPWETLISQMAPALRAWEAIGGEGLRILSGTTSSPSFKAQMDAVRQRFPQAEWVQYETTHTDGAVRAARAAFGSDVELRYDLSNAERIVALDADFLTSGAGHERMAAEFAATHNVRGGRREMSRLYAIETTPTPTGTAADHRLPVRPAELGQIVAALAAKVGVAGVSAPSIESAKLNEWVDAIADDLLAHRGSSVVIPGDYASEAVHVLAHSINSALAAFGSTVNAIEPVLLEPSEQDGALSTLAEEMSAGQVEALFVLGCNPVYDAPADVDFAAAMASVGTRLHLGLYHDETAAHCQWHVPQAHYLEGWGDARSPDGTLGVIQPLIEPMFDGRTDTELLAVLAGRPAESYDIVRATWSTLGDDAWQQALHDGFAADTAASTRDVTLSPSAAAEAAGQISSPSEGIDVVLRPDPHVFDGRFANNGWLQELPRPLTKVTWDQVAWIAPATAEAYGVETGHVISVSIGDRKVEAPVWIMPGQPHDVITLHFGFGRTSAGKVGNGIGANVNDLRNSGDGFALSGAEIADTGRRIKIASTQEHYQIEWQQEQAEARHLLRYGTLEKLEEDEHFVEHMGHHVPDAPMFGDWKYDGYSWGMVIDLGACTGCNACSAACVAENNIPVVGKEQVLAGREMQWLRIDRYYSGDLDDPAIHHQPVACQHCERAPCEVVCPVGATVHGDEGLNEMVYNRCIGTRYCSNNCPYKVRRFNFFLYQDKTTPILKLARNPNVSVRSRGVMEKCTYCVQRINAARQTAKVERRRIRDGEVITACQEACPTGAIAFGDLNDPNSEVVRWKQEAFEYSLLPEIAVEPRTTYLAKITNPNPVLVADHGQADSQH